MKQAYKSLACYIPFILRIFPFKRRRAQKRPYLTFIYLIKKDALYYIPVQTPIKGIDFDYQTN